MKTTHLHSTKSSRLITGLLLATGLAVLNVPAADAIWVGNSSANWNTTANWSPASVPATNDQLFFDVAGSAGTSLNNDLTAGTVFTGITFNSTASAFTFSGNDIGLNGRLTNASTSAQVINNNIVLNGNSTITNIGAVTLNGVISGAFSLTENSTPGQSGFVPASPLYLNGANTFSGNVVVSGGALWITNASALGTGIKTNIIAGGGRPELRLNGVSGNIVIPTNHTFLTSSGAGNTTGTGVGTLVNDAGDNVIEGNINLIGGGGNTIAVVSAGTLTLAGKISPTIPNRNLVLRGAFNGAVSGEIADGSTASPLASVDKRDAGTWTLTGTNTHTGATTVNGGVLKMGHSSALGYGGLQTTNTAGTTVGSGFTLDLNGMTGVNEQITIAGGGITNGGALANYSASPASVDSGIAGLAVSGMGSGSGFSSAPTVVISGTGSGATATASLGITAASITAGALGDKIYNTDSNGLTTASFTVDVIGDKVYSVAPDVTISGGGGGGATATAVLNTNNNVSGITIVFCGTNYTSEPTLALSGGTVDSGTSDTTFIGNTNQFTKTPTVTISGGTGATATPVLSFGVVTGITLTAAGTGFTGAPTLTISGGVISGTTDTEFTGNATNFCVGGLAMTAAGNGYTGTPTVTFNGSPATVTPTLSSVILGGGSRIGGAGDLTVSAVISESTALKNAVKTGAGKTTFLGSNTFSGTLTVEAGALWITNISAMGTGTKTNIIVGNGRPELHLNGISGNIVIPATTTLQTSSGAGVGAGVGALVNEAGDNQINGRILMAGGGGNTCLTVAGGTLTMAGGIAPTTTARLLYLRGAANGTVSGVISNGSAVNLLVGVIKQDAGTWTLSAANTYGTNTFIGGGTLLVNGSLASGGSVIVSNTATLGGSGTINPPTTVLSGGTIKGGNAASAGTLTVANTLTLGNGTNAVTSSQFLISAGGKVSATTLAVTGTNVVNILDSSLTVGTNILFSYTGSIGGSNGFAGFKLGTLPAGVTAQLLNSGSAVRLGVTSVFTVNTNSPVLTNSFNGGVLALSWPTDRLGWRLQVQTNSLDAGLSSNWSTWPNSTNVTSVLFTNNPANPSVFFRLVYP